jgi:ABC-type antimicrobial peptide transport system permease subunit
MQKDRYKAILRESPEPPAYLAGKILRSIEREERKRVFRQIAVSGVFLFVSLGSAVASVMDLGNKLSQSGFLSFASLFHSDFSFAMINFRELSSSLVESFPAISAAFCLASAAFVLWFGMRLISEAGVIRRNRFVVR